MVIFDQRLQWRPVAISDIFGQSSLGRWSKMVKGLSK